MGKKLVFFDMDHTLIDNDCDVSWKYFVVKHGLAGEDALREADAFFADYQRGELDEKKFSLFQLREFMGRDLATMQQLARQHFQEFVRPKVYRAAMTAVQTWKKQGICVGMLTATNLVLAAPLAEFFGFDHLLGTTLEMRDGVFTGRVAGEYAGGIGKVNFAQAFLREQQAGWADFTYYGDSINDRWILDRAGTAWAVNAGADLLALAKEKNWHTDDFRADGYLPLE